MRVAEPTAVVAILRVPGARLRAAGGTIERLRPVYVLSTLTVLAWAGTLSIALSATHNGWLYYTGGDATYYWSAAYGFVHGWVAAPAISYGLPVLLWPVAAAAGANLLVGLPAIVLLQVAVLTPLLLVALYGIGSYFGGRLLGYIAAAGWVVAPFLALGYFERGFREDVHDLVVPNAVGLTLLGDFASLVAVTVAAALLLRTFERPGWNDVLLAGLVSGFAIGIKPSNTIFLAAPVLALVVARRWRQLPAFLAALLPAVIALTIWKRTGIGSIPVLSLGEVRSAAGPAFAAPPVAAVGDYLPFDWATFHDNLLELREVGWSVLLLEWAAVVGALALIRRAPAAGVLVATWFFSYVLLKGGAEGRAGVMQTSFFRLIEPAFPAFVLLVAGLVFLVPTRGRRRAGPVAAAPWPERPSRALAATAVVLALYPLVLVAAASAAPRDRFVHDEAHNQAVPVDAALDLRVSRQAGGVRLDWRAAAAGAGRVAYRVYRSPGPGCDHHSAGVQDCLLRMAQVATVRGTTWTDTTAKRWTYRIAAVADQRPQHVGGDLVVVSRAVR